MSETSVARLHAWAKDVGYTAPDTVARLTARIAELEAALTWYSVAADWELKADGGDRARAALSNFP